MSGIELLIAGLGSAASAGASAVGSLAPILGAAGTAATVVGGIAQAEAQKDAAKVQQNSLNAQASDERASSQRAAEQERRRTNMIVSKQTAGAAASGAGTGGTIADIMSATEAQGRMAEEREYYLGNSRAAGLEDQAKATGRKAKADYTGTLLDTAGTAGRDLYNMRRNYG